MKIKVREVKTIPVTYIDEDNYFEFEWVYGIVLGRTLFGTRSAWHDRWHVSVF